MSYVFLVCVRVWKKCESACVCLQCLEVRVGEGAREGKEESSDAAVVMARVKLRRGGREEDFPFLTHTTKRRKKSVILCQQRQQQQQQQ